MVAAAPSLPSHETLHRNPVDASALQPAPPPASTEKIEKSQLPLTLLGTFAASEPVALARDASPPREPGDARGRRRRRDRRAHARRADRAGAGRTPRQRFAPGAQARGRVCALRSEPPSRPPRDPMFPFRWPPSTRRRGSRTSRARSSTPRAARPGCFPSWRETSLVGLHVSTIQEGSRFAQIGIEEDDVITQFNGISIDSPFLVLHAAREMVETDGYHVMVRRGDAMMHLDGRRDTGTDEPTFTSRTATPLPTSSAAPGSTARRR